MADISVDLFNPGQVFACLGFLEVADVLLGDAVGGFDWRDDANVRFRLRATGTGDPFEEVLDFLAQADVKELEPVGWPGDPGGRIEAVDCFPSRMGRHQNDKGDYTRNAFPVRLSTGKATIDLTHWSDGSSRADFKLYSGNRSAADIAGDMLDGTRKKPKKGKSDGEVQTLGFRTMWLRDKSGLLRDPLHALTSVGGSFNFDARRSWTGIDAGYSPNDQDHGVESSPGLEVLAALGLEHARPHEYGIRQVRYGAWGIELPPMLARPALAGPPLAVPMKRFQFALDLSGKNKVVTFAQEEMP